MTLFGARVLLVTLLRDASGELRWPEARTFVTTLQVVQTAALGILLLIAALLSEQSALRREQDRAAVAERMAADADRLDSLGRLAGGLAHDFNNVLMVVSASLELAEAVPNDPAIVQEELRTAIDAAAHGRGLRGQLLAFARHDQATSGTFDPGVAVDRVVSMLRRLVDHRSTIAVAHDSTGAMPFLRHAAQFEQVVMNLVLNGRDAMPNGGTISVALSVDPPKTNGGSPEGVRLSVEDSGVGIPSDILPEIFKPLFTTKTEQRGTGLGLATIETIVKKARGTIDVASELGRGTRFTVCLSVARAANVTAGAIS